MMAAVSQTGKRKEKQLCFGAVLFKFTVNISITALG